MNTTFRSSNSRARRSERTAALAIGFLVAALLLSSGACWTAHAAPPKQEVPPSRLPYDGPFDAPHLPGATPHQEVAPVLTEPEYVNWSRLVFQSARNQHDWEIFGARGDGSNQVNLSNNGSADIQPRQNRDATRVVFASNRHGTYEIFAMNANGGGQTRLTNNTTDDVYPAWSPDGSKIVFQAYRDGQPEIYVMNANGSSQTRLTNYGDYDGMPAWSPDGTRIAFVRKQSGQYRVWVMNANGSNPQQRSNQPFSEGPAWSPNGMQIAYDADGNNDGWQEIWLMDASGSNQRQVYDPPASNTDAWVGSWSPDGRYVAFTRISFIQQGGTWYWTQALLAAWDSTNPTSILSLSNSGLDWNPDWQSLDRQAPSSAVHQLPRVSRALGVEVQWSGSDVGPAGLAGYDVEYRVGTTGTWIRWQDNTLTTSALFSGTGGQSVAFRSRARDYAGNLEAWPANDAADTSTTFYTWQLAGQLTDNRGAVVRQASVTISPDPLEATQTDAEGSYLALLTANGDHSMTVNQAGYGPLNPPALAVNSDRTLDLYLPPAQNLAINGGFESGAPLPSAWTMGGPADAVTVSSLAHTGARALMLGKPCPYPCLSGSETIANWSNQYPDMASDSQGNLYLLWYGYDNGGFQARSAVKPVGGSWSAPENLGPIDGGDPRVGIAVDGKDVVHAVWSQQNGLYYRQRTLGTAWSPAQQLVDRGGTVDIAADHLGGVHIIYFDYDPGTAAHSVRYLERLPSGVWQPPVTLDDGYRGPAVVVGPNASVHFLYQKIDEGVFYRWRPRGGAILPDEQVWAGVGYSFENQILAVDSDGTVHAVINWNAAYYRQQPAGGVWSTPEALNTNGASALAVDSAGTLHLAGWTSTGPYALYYRNRPYTGIWQAPVVLGDSNNDGPGLAIDPQGNVHLACFLMAPSQGLYYWKSLAASETFTVTAAQQVTIPATMHRPTVAADYASAGGDIALSVVVGDGVTTTQVFSDTASNAWRLASADLSPWAGQTVTITFMLRQVTDMAYTRVRLDDVTIGEWPTPVITAVEPAQGQAWTATPIVVHGVNFVDAPTVRVGPTAARNVTWIDEYTLQATVPATLAPGIYDIEVTNPNGAASMRPNTFRSGRSIYLPLTSRS